MWRRRSVSVSVATSCAHTRHPHASLLHAARHRLARLDDREACHLARARQVLHLRLGQPHRHAHHAAALLGARRQVRLRIHPTAHAHRRAAQARPRSAASAEHERAVLVPRERQRSAAAAEQQVAVSVPRARRCQQLAQRRAPAFHLVCERPARVHAHRPPAARAAGHPHLSGVHAHRAASRRAARRPSGQFARRHQQPVHRAAREVRLAAVGAHHHEVRQRHRHRDVGRARGSGRRDRRSGEMVVERRSSGSVGHWRSLTLLSLCLL